MGILSKRKMGEEAETKTDFEVDFHFPTSDKALLIFTRNPELGKCKTRLAATVGDEAALHIYKFLLRHTAEITEKIKVDKFVYYSEGLHKEDIWDDNRYTKRVQRGEDLGARMENAFAEAFTSGYRSVVIIGSDLYDFTQPEIEHAFKQLQDHEVVIGPAKDGGYYLLGMKTLKPHLFAHKKWGTTTVLQETLNDLKQESVAQLPPRNDVDYYEDIKDVEVFKKYLPKTLKV